MASPYCRLTGWLKGGAASPLLCFPQHNVSQSDSPWQGEHQSEANKGLQMKSHPLSAKGAKVHSSSGCY